MQEIIPIERIESKIFNIRNQQVMLDRDLAKLYEVETEGLTRAVRRNIDRFPEDFMFQLDYKEFTDLKRHFGGSSWGGTRKLPLAFTENGVAMLSSVLRSKKAIQVNIQIMRAFNYLKRRYLEEKEVDKKIELLTKKHDEDVTFIFMELDRLDRLIESKTSKTQIGFKKED